MDELLRTALAHGTEHAADALWSQWPLSVDVTLTSLLVVVIYIAGVRRRQHRIPRSTPWRHGSFFIGIAAVFIALQSPVDPIAERAFWMHQIQHLLLRMLGPFLIMLSMPQATMTAGLPVSVRRRILVPVVGNSVVRGCFGFLAHPVVATVFFIFTLAFWQLPDYHNLALRSEPVHYLMHVSMLLSGLFFWWRILDFRPRPLAAPYVARILMLWTALAVNVVLGAYLFFKRSVLYAAYDDLGRLWDLDALADERAGALILWLPGSMMLVIGILIVIGLGMHYDRKRDGRSTAEFREVPARRDPPALKGLRVRNNRAVALALAAFVVLIISTMGALVLVINRSGQ